jgi:hypothetical protein
MFDKRQCPVNAASEAAKPATAVGRRAGLS